MKTTFLHGDLEEEIQMKQPKGFSVTRTWKELAYKLKNIFYGLKQYLRIWYQNFNTCIPRFGFVRIKVDHCAYPKQVSDHFINIVLYVDDMMLLIESKMKVIK